MTKKNRVVNKTRRANNEGSVFQRKDGRWAGYISVGFDKDGKPIRKFIYGKTQTEVAKKLSDLSGRLNSQSYDMIEKKNFGELMQDWLLIFKKSSVTPRSFEGNIRNFKLHILPIIGNMKLYSVDVVAIQKVINKLFEQGYSTNLVKKNKHMINQFFEYAIDSKWVNINPTQKIKIRSKDRKIYTNGENYKALPPEIREKFLDALNKDESNFLKPLCICLMFAGVRIGEALALRWSNIHFNTKTIKIEQGITQVPRFDENGNILERVTVVSDTKTACSVREIPVTDIVLETLSKWKEKQKIRSYDINLDLTKPNMFVFANDDGSVRTYSGSRIIFDRFKTRNKLDKYNIHFHGLRHTFSNMLFEMNENPKVIQQLLGHRDVKTTITVYNSVNSEYVREATDKLNEKINSSYKPEEQETKQHGKLDEMEDDDINELLEELLKQKQERKRKREKDFDM